MLTGKQFGRYRIGHKIGEGGMGEVYSAHDDELDRSVAIKLLPQEFLIDEDRSRRFRQEARSVSALTSKGIWAIKLKSKPKLNFIWTVKEDFNKSWLTGVVEQNGTKTSTDFGGKMETRSNALPLPETASPS